MSSCFYSCSLSSLDNWRSSILLLISSKFKGAVCTSGFVGNLTSFLRLFTWHLVLDTFVVYGKDWISVMGCDVHIPSASSTLKNLDCLWFRLRSPVASALRANHPKSTFSRILGTPVSSCINTTNLDIGTVLGCVIQVLVLPICSTF